MNQIKMSNISFPSSDDFWAGLENENFPGVDRQVKVVKRQVETVSSGGQSSLEDDLLGYKSEVVTEGEDSKFRLHVNVKTFKPENINLSVKDSVLTIEAKTEDKSEDGMSCAYRKIARRFTFPQNVDLTGVTSSLSDEGILKIDAPLAKNKN